MRQIPRCIEGISNKEQLYGKSLNTSRALNTDFVTDISRRFELFCSNNLSVNCVINSEINSEW